MPTLLLLQPYPSQLTYVYHTLELLLGSSTTPHSQAVRKPSWYSHQRTATRYRKNSHCSDSYLRLWARSCVLGCFLGVVSLIQLQQLSLQTRVVITANSRRTRSLLFPRSIELFCLRKFVKDVPSTSTQCPQLFTGFFRALQAFPSNRSLPWRSWLTP